VSPAFEKSLKFITNPSCGGRAGAILVSSSFLQPDSISMPAAVKQIRISAMECLMVFIILMFRFNSRSLYLQSCKSPLVQIQDYIAVITVK